MNLINKSFKNLETGEIYKIVDSYQNLAITDKREKLDVNRLMDPRYYSEYNDVVLNESKTSYLDYIDPKSFFNDPKMYSVFAEKIKNIDLSKIPDEEENVSFSVDMNDSISPVTNESAIVITEQESEIEELKRKYGAVDQIQNNSDIIQQNEAFAKILEEDEEEYQVETHHQHTQDLYVDVPLTRQIIDKKVEVIDPIITMFKNVKRNTDFSFDIKIDGKIPRLDFIEMMEDSYDTSIIEFLANEFTENLFIDKESLKIKISNEIKSIVYKTKEVKDQLENNDALFVKEVVKIETPVKKRVYKKRNLNENSEKSIKKDKTTSK